jgi:hypothetical protein
MLTKIPPYHTATALSAMCGVMFPRLTEAWQAGEFERYQEMRGEFRRAIAMVDPGATLAPEEILVRSEKQGQVVQTPRVPALYVLTGEGCRFELDLLARPDEDEGDKG